MNMTEYNMKELCEREHITVEEVINFFALIVPGFCLLLRFWVGIWSTFSCLSCFDFESRQMRYLNFCGKVQECKTC